MIGEDRIIEELEANRVDYVMILARKSPDYGERVFGVNYGKKILAWMGKNYEKEKQIGPYPPSSGDFAIFIMKRK